MATSPLTVSGAKATGTITPAASFPNLKAAGSESRIGQPELGTLGSLVAQSEGHASENPLTETRLEAYRKANAPGLIHFYGVHKLTFEADQDLASRLLFIMAAEPEGRGQAAGGRLIALTDASLAYSRTQGLPDKIKLEAVRNSGFSFLSGFFGS